MAELELAFLVLSLTGIIMTLIFTIAAFASRRSMKLTAGEGDIITQSNIPLNRSKPAIAADIMTFAAILFTTLTIVLRGINSGHAPFSNMYEFALSFVWGIMLMGIIFQKHYKTASIKNMGLIVALLLTIFALVQSLKQLANPLPLVPALQQSALLSAHVASAIVAYGTFTIGFGAAVLFLIQNKKHLDWLPDMDVLDTISYQSVKIGFPFMTLLIVLGALWANIAWGRYWSWDPKETASLVTWLLYAAYIHARGMRGWRGSKTAMLLILGFAAVLLTFFGNYIFSGLHAYTS